jgi:hypothetical protein
VRVLAVDWSGAEKGQRRTIWLAEVVDGALVRLEAGRTRAEFAQHLIDEAERDPQLVVGLDFAFSLPAWYLRERGIASARRLWELLSEEALTPRMRELGLAAWMADPEPPFWGRAGKRAAGLRPDQEFRRTDEDQRSRGFPAKSVFQLVGAGQVGPGSLRGMQVLHRLAEHGFHVWPFDPPGFPLVVEIFPRALTGAVTKSSHGERERYLARVDGLDDAKRRLAASSEDAFDAAVSALVMAGHVDELTRLAPEPAYSLEGRIWFPEGPGRRQARPKRGGMADADGPGALVGAWRLLSWQNEAAGGRVTYPMGHDPLGYLIYAADGRFSVTISRRSRAPFAAGDLLGGSTDEKAAAVEGFTAYAGRYTFDGERVVHHVELSLFPNWAGSDQERAAEISGNTLTLSAGLLLLAGERQVARLVWERVGPARADA